MHVMVMSKLFQTYTSLVIIKMHFGQANTRYLLAATIGTFQLTHG